MTQRLISILLVTLLLILLAFIVVLLILLSPGFTPYTPTLVPTITPTISNQYMDKSFLTGEPCQAPCWYNLEVNQANKEEVMDVVSSLSFLNSDNMTETRIGYFEEIREESLPAMLINVECMAPENKTCATFILVENILKSIYISPNYSISFIEAVEILGPPNYVRIWPDTHNIEDCDIALQWTDKLIEVSDIRAGFNNPERCAEVFNGLGVSEDLSVDVIIYMAHEDSILIRNPGDGGQPWYGFIEN